MMALINPMTNANNTRINGKAAHPLLYFIIPVNCIRANNFNPKLPRPSPSVKFKIMENNLPANFLAWHWRQALPQFVKSRLQNLATTFGYFNILTLSRSLFTPYRRLVQRDKTSILDRLSFNLISIAIGATVRAVLIIAGVTAAIIAAIFDLLIVILYSLLPLLSLPKYLNLRQNLVTERDIQNPKRFVNKLTASPLFHKLYQFFDNQFASTFGGIQPAALEISKNQTIPDVIITLAKEWPKLEIYLEQKSVKIPQFKLLVESLARQQQTPEAKPQPIGRLLSFGYTNTLEKFSTELTKSANFRGTTSQEILAQIEKVLNRPQNNNLLLVGEPGVGRHATLENLAVAIAQSFLPSIKGKRLMLLDTIALAGSAKTYVEIENNFQQVLVEAKNAGNIILAIDQIDRIASPRESRLDLSQVLTTVLKNNSLPIIGITTIDDFNEFIRPNVNFLKLFEKIDIEEPTEDQTVSILTDIALDFLQKEKIATRFTAILEIVEKSNRLLPERKQPEKSILLLEDCLAEAKSRGLRFIDENLVDAVLGQKTKTPVGKITQGEASILKNLEGVLHKRIIGQNEAIEEIAKSLRRARAGIETGKKPIGSFLLLGPTGVGKTETAKALAQLYFGSEENMIRLDMSEYQGQDSINRLIGDAQNKNQGILTSLIRQHPYGLLLVDEFEKANTAVHNLFLQILDEGFLTDATGHKASFDNIIIIATSNAGGEFIREQLKVTPGVQISSTPQVPDKITSEVGFDSSEVEKIGDSLPKNLTEYILDKGLFTPELINRFDGVIVYHPLTPEEVVQVAALMLKNLAKKIKETKNITLVISPDLAKKVAEAGFDPAFGARTIRRLIADKIEDEIARMIIDGSIKNGDKIETENLLKLFT